VLFVFSTTCKHSRSNFFGFVSAAQNFVGGGCSFLALTRDGSEDVQKFVKVRGGVARGAAGGAWRRRLVLNFKPNHGRPISNKPLSLVPFAIPFACCRMLQGVGQEGARQGVLRR